MDPSSYADIIVLALVAGFILLRLRSILGDKSGHEKPDFFKRDAMPAKADNDIMIQVSDKAKHRPVETSDIYANTLKNEHVASVIAEVKKLDASFNASSFLAGAKMAYEMVFDAFAKGDKKTLEMLLDKSIYNTFASEIEARTQQSNKMETTLVSVIARDIVQATLSGTRAQLTVKFDSEQVHVVKNAAGEIIEGDVSQMLLMDDEWIFERDITSKSPNWKIIET